MIYNKITGQTDVYGIIGDPVAYTLSPLVQNTLAGKLNHNIIYVPFHVREENLGAAIQGAHALNIQGFNVTHPHKQNVIKYTVDLDKTAKEAGVVNTMRYTDKGYIGYNTDIHGVKNTFRARGVSLAGKTAVILGAGGGARAAALAVAAEGPDRLFIVNRTVENAVFLARLVKSYYNIDVCPLSFSALSEIKKAYLVLQTTSIGFGRLADRSPIDPSFFQSVEAEVAFDMIYNPWETEFLKAADKSGCLCINGFDMLIYQAVAAYEIWRSESLPDELARELMDEVLREK